MAAAAIVADGRLSDCVSFKTTFMQDKKARAMAGFFYGVVQNDIALDFAGTLLVTTNCSFVVSDTVDAPMLICKRMLRPSGK